MGMTVIVLVVASLFVVIGLIDMAARPDISSTYGPAFPDLAGCCLFVFGVGVLAMVGILYLGKWLL